MAIYTFTIELRVDIADDAVEHIAEVVKDHARDMLSMASLLQHDRRPTVAVKYLDGFWSGTEVAVFSNDAT